MADTTKGRSSGLAIAGLVLGILDAASSFLPIINNLSAIIAVVGGILSAAAFVGANKGKHDAKGMSIAGIVLAIVSFVIVLATQSMYSAALKSAAEELKTGSKPVETTEQQSPDQNAPAEQAPAEPAPAEPAPEEQAPAEQAVDWSHMPLGQTVTLEDGLSITANSVGIITKSYSDEQLACVNVTYVNNGSSNASFSTFDWKSENANGVQTSASYNSSDNEQLESGQLVPGGTITANVYFSADATRILYFSNIFQSESQIGWVIA
jgi:biotin carboxyl carrier protein